jgi:hypothetical protein
MIKLADGSEIDPATRQVINAPNQGKVKQHAAPNPRVVARQRRHTVKRRIFDLAVEPKTANMFGLVIFYVLLGLPDNDICECTGLSYDQLMAVRANDNYDELRSMLVGEVRASQQTDVRGLLEDSADAAAERILSLMDSGDEKVSLAAAKDVLDRAGHRPADVVEHRHSFDNEMRIRIIEDQAIDIPVLDLEVEEV